MAARRDGGDYSLYCRAFLGATCGGLSRFTLWPIKE